MSYCRFSSNNWMCDVYVYQDSGGMWVIHVAGRRRLFAPFPPQPSLKLAAWSPRLWVILNRIHYFVMELIPFRDINHPDAGKSFYLATPGECAEKLDELQSGGLNVPNYAINDLLEEEKEYEQEERENRLR